MSDCFCSSIADILVAITSVFALWLSAKSYIRENENRKEDEKQRIKQQKKEDKIRQWNALYPYRIKFYTEFYDTLFQFVEYKGKPQQTPDATLMNNGVIYLNDIDVFLKKFNKFTEEAKVLFDRKIQKDVRSIYLLVKEFMENPYFFNQNEDNYSIIGGHLPNELRENLQQVQHNVRDLKLDEVLRHRFEQILTMEGNRYE